MGWIVGDGWSPGMGSWDVYCLLGCLLVVFSADRMFLKSVIAREGARIVGSSSSSSSSTLLRARWKLVPARCWEKLRESERSASWLDSRRLSLISMLVLRASMRVRALLGLTPTIELLSGSMLCRTGGDSPLTCTLGRRDGIMIDVRTAGLANVDLLSHKLMQSSVRPRQILSALRRT